MKCIDTDCLEKITVSQTSGLQFGLFCLRKMPDFNQGSSLELSLYVSFSLIS